MGYHLGKSQSLLCLKHFDTRLTKLHKTEWHFDLLSLHITHKVDKTPQKKTDLHFWSSFLHTYTRLTKLYKNKVAIFIVLSLATHWESYKIDKTPQKQSCIFVLSFTHYTNITISICKLLLYASKRKNITNILVSITYTVAIWMYKVNSEKQPCTLHIAIHIAMSLNLSQQLKNNHVHCVLLYTYIAMSDMYIHIHCTCTCIYCLVNS